MLGKAKTTSYLMLFDRIHNSQSIIKAFVRETKITCINYGPYDNGHVLVGLEDGTLLAFESLKLEKIFKIKIF